MWWMFASGQRVSAFEQQERGPYNITTDEGHEYKFDYVIKCNGFGNANTEFAKPYLSTSFFKFSNLLIPYRHF